MRISAQEVIQWREEDRRGEFVFETVLFQSQLVWNLLPCQDWPEIQGNPLASTKKPFETGFCYRLGSLYRPGWPL